MCQQNNVEIKINCSVIDVSKNDNFELETTEGILKSTALVIATGGLSIPQIGASDFAYRIAQKFGLKIVPTRPALVPLSVAETELFASLSGVSNHSVVKYKKASFKENILFTHRGLSGPAILQISSYLEQQNGENITIDFSPDLDLRAQFIIDKNNKQTLGNYLKNYFTNRLIDNLALPEFDKSMTDLRKDSLQNIAEKLHNFTVQITGTEGYKKAEVTVGGIDTDELSSKTMEAKKVPNLFFIGEAVDVTGWLGGYNFQWAWASGFATGNILSHF
jgi:predicted Rossmann fold flavoprotein